METAADQVTNAYDQAGNITGTSDQQGDGATQTQCYAYNHLGELTTAWTDTGGLNIGSTVDPGLIGHCVNTTPAPATIGGPAPYWQDYTYNLLGDRATAIYHDLSGNTSNDITQTLTYPGSGTTPASQPDAPATIVTRQGGTSGPSTTLTPGYDAAGNTTSRIVTHTTGTNPPAGPRPQAGITYNPDGLTATVTTSSGTSGYTYDASGNLLLQTTPAGTTLYLDGGTEQLTYHTSTGKITAQRFYPAPDGTVAVRTYDPTANPATTLTFDLVTPQGTPVASVRFDNDNLTRRYYDPYGNPAGTIPAWPDNHAYLGKPADPNTSLNLLGARQYDPATGRFLSLDPVFQPGNPLTMGGYAYAANNPATNADPSGLYLPSHGGTCSPDQPGCPGYGSYVPISPNFVVQNSSPYYQSMVSAWHATMSRLNVSAARASQMSVTSQIAAWDLACGYGGGNICPAALNILLARFNPTDPLVPNPAPAALTPGARFSVGSAFATGAAVLVPIAGMRFFRGAAPGEAPTFELKPGEYRMTGTGVVRGLSLFNYLSRFRKLGPVPYEVVQPSVPDALAIEQRGADPGHFEIVPANGAFIPQGDFQALLNQIDTTPVDAGGGDGGGGGE